MKDERNRFISGLDTGINIGDWIEFAMSLGGELVSSLLEVMLGH